MKPGEHDNCELLMWASIATGRGCDGKYVRIALCILWSYLHNYAHNICIVTTHDYPVQRNLRIHYYKPLNCRNLCSKNTILAPV